MLEYITFLLRALWRTGCSKQHLRRAHVAEFCVCTHRGLRRLQGLWFAPTFFLFAHHVCALSLYCTSVNLSAAVDCIAAVECIALVLELFPWEEEKKIIEPMMMMHHEYRLQALHVFCESVS